MRPLFPQPEDKAERDLEVGDWLKVIAKDLAKHLPREEADVILKGLQSPLEDLWWDLLLFEKIETVIDEKSYLEERIERLKTDSGNIQSLFKFAKMPPGMAEATIAGLKFLESKFDSQMENLNKEVLSKRNLPKKNLDLYNVRSLNDNIRDSLNRIHKHLSNVTKMKNLADHVFWRLRRDWISSEIPFNRDFELTSASCRGAHQIKSPCCDNISSRRIAIAAGCIQVVSQPWPEIGDPKGPERHAPARNH